MKRTYKIAIVLVLLCIGYIIFDIGSLTIDPNSACSRYKRTGYTLLEIEELIQSSIKNENKPPDATQLKSILTSKKISADAWGNAIVYKILDSESYILYSVGNNGIDDAGLNDDILIKGSGKFSSYCSPER